MSQMSPKDAHFISECLSHGVYFITYTMGQILSNWRILGASFLSVAFIVGAYMLARGVESPALAQASTESELLQAIAKKDSDGDGLSDWEESLYGTNPRVTDSFNLGITDGEAVAKGLIVPKAIAELPPVAASPTVLDEDGLPPAPREGTLTDAFTRNFLEIYAAAKQVKGGAELSNEERQRIATEAINSLSSLVTAAPDYKSARGISVSGTGPDALNVFAGEVEAVFSKNTAYEATETEVVYLKDALEHGNTAAFTYIALLAKSYRDTAVGLAMLTVPLELRDAYLLLINSLMRESQIANDLMTVNTDPLTAIVALEQYPEVVQSLRTAVANIGNKYATAGISLPPGVPGAAFVKFAMDIAASRL